MLKLEQNIFNIFQENYPIGFFSINPDRKIIGFNSQFKSLTGFSSTEIENAPGAGMILWPTSPSECKVCKVATEYISRQESGNADAYITRKDGKIVPVYVYVVPIYINDTKGEKIEK